MAEQTLGRRPRARRVLQLTLRESSSARYPLELGDQAPARAASKRVSKFSLCCSDGRWLTVAHRTRTGGSFDCRPPLFRLCAVIRTAGDILMKFHSIRTACRCDFGLHVDRSGMPLRKVKVCVS